MVQVRFDGGSSLCHRACSKHIIEGQTEAAVAEANVGRQGQAFGSRSAKTA
jgi:hypothetical protein